MYQKIKEYFEVHKQEMLDDIMAAIQCKRSGKTGYAVW